MVFRKMDTEEVSDRFVAPCFVNGLEAYDGEINLGVEENMISNDFAVKLCLEHEVKRGNKLVKKELIVALRGELYFVKFIINLKEDNVEPGVIFGRSFMRLVNGIVDFGNGVITVYPEEDPFEDNSEKIEKSLEDWDQLLDFNFNDTTVRWRRTSTVYIGPSSSTGRHLTQEEAAKEALALRISQRFALLEEIRPILETMAYNDKYKKVLDEIWKDKVKLDGMIAKEEEEAINKVKGEALKEKDDPVGVTTLIAKFLILDIPIDRDAPVVVGRGFLYTIGGIVNTPERLFSTFDGICHQTFRAARSDVLRTEESDSDDEEEYEIKRNKFGAPIYGPKSAAYLNCNDPAKESIALQGVINPFWKINTMGGNDDEARSSRSKRSRQYETVEEILLPQVHHKFLLWDGCNKEVKSRMGCDGEIDDMLRIKLRKAGSNEEIFTSVAWIRAFNINEPIYSKLCHEFYSTYEFDEVCADDELQTKKIIKFRLGGRAHCLTLLEFACRLGLYHAEELDEGKHQSRGELEFVLESSFYYSKPSFEGDSQDDHLCLVHQTGNEALVDCEVMKKKELVPQNKSPESLWISLS
ncbi:hypothetical protein Tco_1111208 [Tanacetum coccineum]|uniref:Uncharacterized protein n=1 Tax=Tanacetum coccineum TaxID=301880 RepID=A0ABQ5IKY9_9ASTR